MYIWFFQFYGYKMTKEEKENPSKKQITHARLLSNLLLGLGFPLLAGSLFYYFFNPTCHSAARMYHILTALTLVKFIYGGLLLFFSFSGWFV